MKTKLSLLLVAILAISAPVSFTGCASPATREAVVYYSFKDTQTAVHRAYDGFAELVVLKKVNPVQRQKVETAYKAFQSTFRVSFKAASYNWDSPAPATLRKLADDLLAVIRTL